MARRLAARAAFAIALVVIAFVGVYVLVALAPGDGLAADGMRSREALAAERVRLGLDQPVLTRLAHRLTALTTLDLGTSTRFGRPVRQLVVERALATLRAGGLALLLALALGIPAGVLASHTRSRALRGAIGAVSMTLLSIPALVLALLLGVLAVRAGASSLLVMVVALALPAAALFERAQARALDAVLHEPWLLAVRARGIPAAQVTWRHAWPLSLPPVLGIVGVVASHLLSGALAIELVTARVGLGRLTFEALVSRDLDLAAGCAGAAALIVGAVTFAADAVHVWLDPRLWDA